MIDPAIPAAFEQYLDELAERARREPDVIGLVGFGSTVERSRVDEWSDHDFGWLTVPGVQDRFRHDLSWLPAAERIALSVVENHGGVKVIYDDGHVLEFGIASLEDFTHWTGDQAAVIVDKGGVAEAVAALLARSATAGETDPVRAVKLLVTQIMIGVGRARRGETLAAAEMICSDGQGRLLSAIGARLPRDAFVFNTLEPWRRFERAYPEIAARIEAARRLDPEAAGRALLDIAEETLADGWDEFPHEGVRVVRDRLGWH